MAAGKRNSVILRSLGLMGGIALIGILFLLVYEGLRVRQFNAEQATLFQDHYKKLVAEGEPVRIHDFEAKSDSNPGSESALSVFTNGKVNGHSFAELEYERFSDYDTFWANENRKPIRLLEGRFLSSMFGPEGGTEPYTEKEASQYFLRCARDGKAILDGIAEVLRKPDLSFAVQPEYTAKNGKIEITNLPGYSALVKWMRFQDLYTRALIHEGNFVEALEQIQLQAAACRLFATSPSISMIDMAMVGRAVLGELSLQLIATNELDEVGLQKLSGALEGHLCWEEFETAMRFERAQSFELLEGMEGVPRKYGESIRLRMMGLAPAGVHHANGLAISKTIKSEILEKRIWEFPGGVSKRISVPLLEEIPWFKEHRLYFFAKGVIFRASSWNVVLDAETNLMLARVACGIERHQLKTGSLPEQLQELVETELLSEKPIDPFTGGSPGYKILSSGDYVIWVTGPDREDNRGRLVQNRRQQGGDVVWTKVIPSEAEIERYLYYKEPLVWK